MIIFLLEYIWWFVALGIFSFLFVVFPGWSKLKDLFL